MAVEAVELREVKPGGGTADSVDVEPLDRLAGRDDFGVAVAPAEPKEIIAQRFRQIAEFTIRVDRERAVALRQLCAVRAMDQRHMGEFRHRPAESVIDL